MKTKFILLGAIVAVAWSCQENIDMEQGAELRSESLKKIESLSNEDVWYEDGCLHFSSADACLDVLNSVSTKDALTELEEKYGFYSLRSFNESLIEELSECETMEEYESLWETCTDYLKFEDDRVMPRVTSAAYAGIANIDGVFYVGNVKHTVVDEAVIVENMDNPTRSSAVTIDYVVPCNMVGTRAEGETSQRYTDERYQSGKFKVFSRTNLLRHVSVEYKKDGTALYHSSFSVQVHVSGQKKKTLTGWNSYKDRFFVDNLHFDIVFENGQGVSFGSYINDYSFSEFGGDIYANQPVGKYAQTDLYEMPMPNGFRCIVHRARSRSIGNCGAVTDINYCKALREPQLSECIEE